MKCRICSTKTQRIISFGRMPIANGFLRDPKQQEFLFDLSVAFCPGCLMVQLEETVPPEMMFNDQYQFLSSTSNAMAAHFKGNAEEILARIAGKEDPLVVELGCNDGIMLKHIAAKGVRHIGIEPSGNVAAAARSNGVNVQEDFFNKVTAAKIIAAQGQADIICGSNVFCHIEDMNSVFEGIRVLLKDDGMLFFEDPYLLDIVRKSSFDQIYDEHVFYFSGLSVTDLARRHGMQLVDMAHQDVHGGSMRYYIRPGTSNSVSSEVEQFLCEERERQLDRFNGYAIFKQNVDAICAQLKETLQQIKRRGQRIAGYGATSKSTTLLNYTEIGPELIDYICDITPNKISKYTPGTHIPIKSYETFVTDPPECMLLLAWNHKKEIFEKEKAYRRKGGKFITYFPKVIVE
jgi:methylation protein EvaC